MTIVDLTIPESRPAVTDAYQQASLFDVVPFWLRHGVDREHGGFKTTLDRDGTVIDADKPIWFQGRGAWMFATLFNTVMWKGPFHVPRMLWYCWRLLDQRAAWPRNHAEE